MSKTAPILLSVVVLFSALGYIAIDSRSNEDLENLFTCDNGEQISLELQNNGFEDCSDSSDEDVIDHSKHLHADPVLEAILVEIEGDQFVTGNVIHDHPMEVRINWVMQSADGTFSGDNIATDMDGAWTFDIEVEDRSQNISIIFRAHNLPEDTWSDNITIIILADAINGCTDSTANNFNSDATNDDGSCDYDLDDDGVLDSDEIAGCTDDSANNYNSEATDDDGSCEYDQNTNNTGENNAPSCDVGDDLTTDVNEMAYLDASNSADADGDTLQNPSWQIIDRPDNSTAQIVNPSSIVSEFTPDQIGNYTIEFYVDDGEDFCKETLVVTAVITIPEITPYTVSQSLTNGTEMTDITFTSIGGHIVSMEIHPELPEGLLFDNQSGRISGTPSEVIAETMFTVYANNSAGSGTASITLTVIELGYDATDLAQFWLDFFQCQSNEDRPFVDDLTTTNTENHQCEVSITLNETHLIIATNGLPNHDFESTLACSGGGDCSRAQSYTWSIPRSPVNDTNGGHDSTNCPEANGNQECAPDRGAVAVAINGVPIFGPEDGPGGDAVAAEHGAYNEDRQPIELGICHGHAAQGGTYHYHADGNCMHWHPAEGESIENDYDESTIQAVAQNTYDGNHSMVIGVAFDGYPIYGFWGYDSQMNIVEMKSSYELKDGETGYNGIDDYKYTEGLGHLDQCNGHFGPTPDFPQGIYHYHTTMQNGDGDMGFPYFLICYHGEADMSSDAGAGQGGGGGGGGNCDGYGETWGPGIGPPPPGCGGQGAQSEIIQISTSSFDPMALIIIGLCLATAWSLRRNRNHP
ncbi:MAG: YHYH protein [Candidatus Poseidoniaceae archaeon]|nr:YHYH protein [Candidatus Poseidoniaceae archaeon]